MSSMDVTNQTYVDNNAYAANLSFSVTFVTQTREQRATQPIDMRTIQ